MGKYIKVFNQKDKAVFNGFRCCGHLNHEQMKSLGVSDTKIKNYQREKLVEKVSYKERGQEENKVCYRLTDKGKELASQKWNYKNFAQATSNHERHNLDVANKYCSLSKSEQQTILNERDVREVIQQVIYNQEETQERDRLQEMLDKNRLSSPDIVYTTEEGVSVAYETVTNNYGVEEISAKIETCTLLKIEYQQNRI